MALATMGELLNDIRIRLGNVERRLRNIGSVKTSGTTAERDVRYTPPANDAERAALANQQVRWFNTDLGWEESYYAATGTTGLTVPGLVAGLAADWYPVGPGGPRIYLTPNAQQSLSPGNQFTNWGAPGSGYSWRRGTDAHFTLISGIVRVKLPGRYRFAAMLGIQNGAGTVVVYTIRLAPDGVTLVDVPSSDYTTLHGSFGSVWRGDSVLLMTVDQSLRLQAQGGTAIYAPGATPSTTSSHGFYDLEYVGPPTVTS